MMTNVTMPETHHDLLTRPLVVALVTLMPDGQPQATPVWRLWDGTHLIVNTARGRQKSRNMGVGAKVTVLTIDPDDTLRWLEVRGTVAREEVDADFAVIDQITRLYTPHERFFGGFAAAERAQIEVRVSYYIAPTHVNAGH